MTDATISPIHADGRRQLPLTFLPAAILLSIYGWVIIGSAALKPDFFGLNHIALGTDWMVFYGAIRSVLDGHWALLMDGDRFTSFLNATMREHLSVPLEFRPWFYPPSFLVLLAPFAKLGFTASYIAFQIFSAALLALVLRTNADEPRAAWPVILAVLASPAASINITDGQLAFLIAALLVSGVRLLPHRPVAAGLVLGLLTFKPQFALLLPIALIAQSQWRALAAAAISALSLALASALVFGIDIWLWWIPAAADHLTGSDPKWIATGRIWGHSVFACVALLTDSLKAASAMQAAATIAGVASVAAAFRLDLRTDERLAILLAATILAAPHSGPYDAVLLAAAAALWLASRADARWRDWLMALGIWLVPVMSPAVYVPAGRFAPLVTVALIALILQRPMMTAFSRFQNRPAAAAQSA
ncbi:MAG: glycosyltransferase family 87 protein [Pseudomonadota bacterium]